MSRVTVEKPPADYPDGRVHRVMIAEYVRAQHVPFMDHAPTSGAWARGDVIYNSEPDAGSLGGSTKPYIGWVCVVSGDFGVGPGPTFKTFGEIAA